MPRKTNKYYEHIKRIRGLMEKAGTIDGNGDGVSAADGRTINN